MNDRVTGGCSLHTEYKPELCDNGKNCPIGYSRWWRVVKCMSSKDIDIVECSKCGEQKTVICNFDDDYD